jgi:HlyD family secretion protein
LSGAAAKTDIRLMKKAKLAVAGAIVLGLGAATVYAVANRGDEVISVRTELVGRQDLLSTVTATGQVQPRSRVALSADITGRIMELAVKEGQMVTKGQFLLRIDAAQYEAAVKRAEAALASTTAQVKQSEANANQSQRNLERTQEGLRQNPSFVTPDQLEQLRTQAEISRAVFEASQHSVDQALAGLQDAKSNLEKTVILAPMSGRITRLNIQEGETAIMGTLNRDAATLLTISDMGVLETRVRVDETDVSRIRIGDSASIQLDAFRDTNFVGRVVQIANSSVRGATATPTGGDQAVDYYVTIELLNAPSETRPDFSASARIVTAKRDNAVAVPIIALAVRELAPPPTEEQPSGGASLTSAPSAPKVKDEEGVFVLGADNKVTFRPVKVGITGEKYFEVLSGLDEGERIVAGPFQAIRSLRDGMIVRTAPTDTLRLTGGLQ